MKTGMGLRYVVSFSVMRVTMEFLTPVEGNQLQALNKFTYDVAVSRV